MNSDLEAVWCRECGAKLDEAVDLLPPQHKPCPACGSSKRHIKVLVEVGIGISVGTRIVGRAPGEKKPFVESRAEPSKSIKLGRDVHHERTIHRNNRYTEKVTDTITGTVLHDYDELLSEHRGHGSAKKRT
jgi:hypothetical protein